MEIKDIEGKLWEAANQLRGNMSAEEYMHIILGILSLKYISDRYDYGVINLKEDGLTIDNVTNDEFYAEYDAFKVTSQSSWKYIMQYASTDEIGQKIDEAFIKLEKDNPMLNGIFNKNYNREGIDSNRLGEVIKIFSDENFVLDKEDIIGRIYEYFLGKFFKDRGQKGGEFYTPKSIVKLIVNLIKPLKGSIYDPACGTGGMLIQAKRYIEEHGGNIDEVSVYGQEYNNITWKLAKLNLILNGFHLIDGYDNGVLGDKSADTFSDDQHLSMKFDYIMANPPFNMKKWGQEKLENDLRWKDYCVPPRNNANYAWLLHMVNKLSINGKAGTVLSNGSLSSSQKAESQIRKDLIANNKVDAIVALPDKLFYTTSIPACIWVFNNNKRNKNILMIDASSFEGHLISKKLRELSYYDIEKITKVYDRHLNGENVEIVGFAKTINADELIEADYSFVPGRYVGYQEEIIDKEEIKKEIKTLAKELNEMINEFKELSPQISNAINKALDYDEDKN